MWGGVVLENYANIGIGSCFHQFCRVGAYAMVGMGSVIVKDVLPFYLVIGNRNVKTSINIIGYKRNYFGDIKLKDIKDMKRLLANNMDLSLCFNEELKDIFENFIKFSKNGVYMKG